MSCALPFQDFVWELVSPDSTVTAHVISAENKTQMLNKYICTYCNFWLDNSMWWSVAAKAMKSELWQIIYMGSFLCNSFWCWKDTDIAQVWLLTLQVWKATLETYFCRQYVFGGVFQMDACTGKIW